MSAATTACRKCDSGMHVESLSGITGKEGDVTVAFSKLPAMACTRGHRQFVSREFPARLLEQLSRSIQLPAAKAKGLFVKRHYCGQCGEALATDTGAQRTFGYDVNLGGVEPFRVEITVPVYACPSCKREQVRSLDEISRQTPAAMARAFQNAEIPPG